MKRAFNVDARADRLDKAIAAAVDSVSRRKARQLIEAGAVFVDGQRCRVASRTLPANTRVVVHTEPEASLALEDIPILFEDDEIVVVDKPAGVHVNETETNPKRSLEWILSERNVHVVHRLDVDTTGVLVFAKTKRTARLLSEAFATRAVDKTYFAIAAGHPEDGWIDAPIGADRRRPRARQVTPNGKPSRTHIEVVSTGHGVAAVVARPETGRTHQIRVHLAHVRSPIIGDVMYGAPMALSANGTIIEAGRPWLHAVALALTHEGTLRRFEAPIPADLRALEPFGLSFGSPEA